MSERTLHERVEQKRGFNYIRLKSGRLLSFWDAHAEAKRAHTALATALSRSFKLATDDDLEYLDWLVASLEEHIGAVRGAMDKRLATLSQRDRIALLRHTEGRTPEEAEAFRRKADELEARL